MSDQNQSKEKKESKPSPRRSTISTSVKVQEGGYTIYINEMGMQLASTSPCQVALKDMRMYADLITFGISEWDRAKQIEKQANAAPTPEPVREEPKP